MLENIIKKIKIIYNSEEALLTFHWIFQIHTDIQICFLQNWHHTTCAVYSFLSLSLYEEQILMSFKSFRKHVILRENKKCM